MVLRPELLPVRAARPPIFAALALFVPPVALLAIAVAARAPKPAADANDHRTYVGTFSPFETSAGDIIVPGHLRDAEAWPDGMVIRPPETHDRIAIGAPADDLLSALVDALLAPASTLL